MPYACFTLEIADRIAHLRLNRPDKANSLIPEFWSEFPQAIADISDNARARVVVISSDGKHFCSGMDISVFLQGGLDRGENREIDAERFRHTILAMQRTFSALEEARQPVLVAIQGACIGAGLDLVTACDCRYAAADAFFAVHETAIGMTADVGAFPRLARVVSEGFARQMAFTAERVPAGKAKEIGLVNEVFPTHETLLDGVMAIAAEIAAHSPLAVTGSKRMLNYARDHSTADALDYVALWNAAMLRPEDIKESYAAKGEKRAASFADLKPIKRDL
jgi:enoyl-CoA hydratase